MAQAAHHSGKGNQQNSKSTKIQPAQITVLSFLRRSFNHELKLR
jgi:hypothetical protein